MAQRGWILIVFHCPLIHVARRQHKEPAIRCLKEEKPTNRELNLMGPGENCYFLERGNFRIDDQRVI